MYGCDENTVNKSDELEKTQTNGDMMGGQMELFEQTNGTSKDALVENVSVPKTCEGTRPDEIHTMYDKLTTNNFVYNWSIQKKIQTKNEKEK